jgi:uncharacterized protein
MPMLLPPAMRASLVPSERLPALPVPCRILSNGEYSPPPQSPALAAYERGVLSDGALAARRQGMAIADWWATPQAMAAAFARLNAVFGPHFEVEDGEAEDADVATARRARLAAQFVFDDQVHFLKDDADPDLFRSLTDLIEISAELLNLEGAGRRFEIDRIKFAQFVTDIFLASDTKVALLSGAPSESDEGTMLSNDMMAAARDAVNQVAGSRRLLTHAVLMPGHPGWLDEMDRVHAGIRPDGWKAYTVGEPFSPSDRRWRLDDEKLMYPAYERMVAAGVTNFAIHKGLLPAEADVLMPGAEPFARIDDLVQAARDWPQINFIIYHAAYRTIPQPTQAEVARFEATGRIDWVSDLAEIPERHGVSNIYADTAASFAFTVLTHPRLAAGMIGTLAKGLGASHVFWGTDSVWYGSPQWQIEALRRLTMPEDLMERFGLPDLGAADGPFKAGMLGRNTAPLYAIDPADYAEGALPGDRLPAITQAWKARGGRPSNRTWGYANGD